MGRFEIQFRVSVEKELERFLKKNRSACSSESLCSWSILDLRQVRGFRDSIDSDRGRGGRILYEMFEQRLVIVVVKIGHRRNVYG